MVYAKMFYRLPSYCDEKVGKGGGGLSEPVLLHLESHQKLAIIEVWIGSTKDQGCEMPLQTRAMNLCFRQKIR
eukprot:1138831-Pelagomonas_calceolata.AAC.4